MPTDDTTEPGSAYAVFQAAVALPPAERDAYIRAACGADTALAQQVQQLVALDSSGDTGSFFGPLLDGRTPLAAQRPVAAGMRFGPYVVEGLIASGGMGAVYKAKRVDDFAQVVAIKVIRPDLLTDAAVPRFLLERQVLAGLAHPNIARLLDGGTADDGSPYAVLEYVDGVSLDKFVAERPDRSLRLKLLASVCRAVEYAHQRAVIHRDLKPGNVLVTAGGDVKVVDFGLARLADRTTNDGLTATGAVVGTLAYMSPEQLNGSGLDTRSDIYALGVIGYELLAGRLPVPVAGKSIAQAARDVCEVEPPRLGSIVPDCRGDLEAVFAKALEKEPARRYATVGELAGDLERYLAGESVLARAPTLFDSARKFASRHTAAVVASAVTLTCILAALITVSAALVHARQQAAEAKLQKQRAEDGRAQARRAVNDVLKRVAHSQQLKVPGLEPLKLELLTDALRHYETFAAADDDDPELPFNLAYATAVVAQLHRMNEQYPEAVAKGRQAVARYEALTAGRPDQLAWRNYHALALEELALTFSATDRAAERTEFLQRALAVREALDAVPGSRVYHIGLARLYVNLGNEAAEAKDYARADEHWGKAHTLLHDLFRPEPRNTMIVRPLGTLCVNMGRLALKRGDAAGAERSFREAIGVFAMPLDRRDEDSYRRVGLAEAHSRLAGVLPPGDEALRHRQAASDILSDVLAQSPLIAKQYNPKLVEAYRELAAALRAAGRSVEAAEAEAKGKAVPQE